MFRVSVRRWLLRAVLVAVGAVVLTVLTALVPRPIYPTDGAQIVRFGYPLPFIAQDVSGVRVSTYPAWVGLEPSRGLELAWRTVAVDVAFYAVAFALGGVMVRAANRDRTRRIMQRDVRLGRDPNWRD